MDPSHRKILIVEDSRTMCQLYKVVLGRDPGTELVFAADGQEGLDRVAQEPDVDLVIVDINMPRLDGIEFLRRARRDLALSAPAIVVSTEGTDADRRAAIAAGADGYLRKPWTPDELIRAISQLRPAAAE